MLNSENTTLSQQLTHLYSRYAKGAYSVVENESPQGEGGIVCAGRHCVSASLRCVIKHTQCIEEKDVCAFI